MVCSLLCLTFFETMRQLSRARFRGNHVHSWIPMSFCVKYKGCRTLPLTYAPKIKAPSLVYNLRSRFPEYEVSESVSGFVWTKNCRVNLCRFSRFGAVQSTYRQGATCRIFCTTKTYGPEDFFLFLSLQ